MTNKIYISGISHCVPGTAISSDALDKKHGFPLGTHYSKTGVKTRFYALEETAIDMAEAAVNKLLNDFDINKESIDCIFSASASSHQEIPTNSSQILGRLNLRRPIPTMDINSTCLSFLSAFHAAYLHIISGIYDTILIVSSERSHIGLSPQNIKINGLFGDGAAAIILSKNQLCELSVPVSVKGFLFETHPNKDLCEIKGGGTGLNYAIDPHGCDKHHLFYMNGSKLFRLSSKLFPPFIDKLMKDSQLSLSDIDTMIPHQASPSALQLMLNRLNMNVTKAVNIVREYGNQIAVSIPTALSLAFQSKIIKPNTNILLCGTAAGLSFGGLVLRVHK